MIEDGIKISELTPVITATDSDLIPIVQSGATSSITKGDLFDGVETKIENSSNYSTTEAVIGTWTNADGTEQPLYRKLVYFTGAQMVVGAWSDFVPLANVETLSKCQIGANDNNTIAIWTDVATSYSNGYVRYYSPSFAHYCNYVVLEYTKTTD